MKLPYGYVLIKGDIVAHEEMADMDAQFERERRCNVDYDKAGHPRKTSRYQSPHHKLN